MKNEKRSSQKTNKNTLKIKIKGKNNIILEENFSKFDEIIEYYNEIIEQPILIADEIDTSSFNKFKIQDIIKIFLEELENFIKHKCHLPFSHIYPNIITNIEKFIKVFQIIYQKSNIPFTKIEELFQIEQIYISNFYEYVEEQTKLFIKIFILTISMLVLFDKQEYKQFEKNIYNIYKKIENIYRILVNGIYHYSETKQKTAISFFRLNIFKIFVIYDFNTNKNTHEETYDIKKDLYLNENILSYKILKMWKEYIQIFTKNFKNLKIDIARLVLVFKTIFKIFIEDRLLTKTKPPTINLKETIFYLLEDCRIYRLGEILTSFQYQLKNLENDYLQNIFRHGIEVFQHSMRNSHHILTNNFKYQYLFLFKPIEIKNLEEIYPIIKNEISSYGERILQQDTFKISQILKKSIDDKSLDINIKNGYYNHLFAIVYFWSMFQIKTLNQFNFIIKDKLEIEVNLKTLEQNDVYIDYKKYIKDILYSLIKFNDNDLVAIFEELKKYFNSFDIKTFPFRERNFYETSSLFAIGYLLITVKMLKKFNQIDVKKIDRILSEITYIIDAKNKQFKIIFSSKPVKEIHQIYKALKKKLYIFKPFINLENKHQIYKIDKIEKQTTLERRYKGIVNRMNTYDYEGEYDHHIKKLIFNDILYTCAINWAEDHENNFIQYFVEKYRVTPLYNMIIGSLDEKEIEAFLYFLPKENKTIVDIEKKEIKLLEYKPYTNDMKENSQGTSSEKNKNEEKDKNFLDYLLYRILQFFR